MKTRYVWILFLTCVLTFCSGPKNKESGQYVTVPETIMNDGVPPIPEEIMDNMKRFADVKSTYFSSWDPTGTGMLVATRLKNTTQIYKLDKAMDSQKKTTATLCITQLLNSSRNSC